MHREYWAGRRQTSEGQKTAVLRRAFASSRCSRELSEIACIRFLGLPEQIATV